jgi:ribosomal protein S18 acetylase RimI-like enzyme
VITRTLRHDEFDAIHRAFVEAFSDYVLPMQPSADALREMFTRRGWVPSLSSGIFEGDRLVAFTLNGFDGTSGYDTGSGVIPTHRRRGLARQTMEHSVKLLREAGATRYVLEVLEPNTAAAALYRSLGFIESRTLDCYILECGGRSHRFPPRRPQPPDPAAAAAAALKAAAAAAALQDVAPSWQNSTSSIQRAKDPHVVLGDEDGYAILFPSTGDVPQLAVRREARRRGVGTRLLETAAAIAQKPLRIINIDSRDEGIAAFLAAVGARRFVRQIEMEFVIQPAPL